MPSTMTKGLSFDGQILKSYHNSQETERIVALIPTARVQGSVKEDPRLTKYSSTKSLYSAETASMEGSIIHTKW